MSFNYIQIKSIFDRVVAGLLILLCSPILILTSIIILMDTGRPILFRQERVGKNQELFSILKFRTMSIDPNRQITQTNVNSEGVTRSGNFLRRWKIDELPQLINVLSGHMSIVGPRPCLQSLITEIDEISLQRFQVKPGLTGLAQVNGNVDLSWPERWAYDVAYVENISFFADFKILLKTIFTIISGEKLNKKG